LVKVRPCLVVVLLWCLVPVWCSISVLSDDGCWRGEGVLRYIRSNHTMGHYHTSHMLHHEQNQEPWLSCAQVCAC
jgi:hypothetical protein